jgi:hypothetical protein
LEFRYASIPDAAGAFLGSITNLGSLVAESLLAFTTLLWRNHPAAIHSCGI